MRIKKILSAIIMISSAVVYGQEHKTDLSKLQFNHLYIVVDSATFTQFLKNYFLHNEFANTDMGMPIFQKVDSTAKTIYIRGENTYIELMGPENKFKEPVGAVGVGFSWDTQIPFDYTIQDYIAKDSHNFLPFEKYEFSWDFKTHKTLWYQSYYVKEVSTKLATWYAFYNPGFLSDLFQERYFHYRRNDYLVKIYNENRILTDVVGITLQCAENDFERIVSEMNLLECKIISRTESSATYKIGELNFTLRVNSSAENSSIQSIAFKTKSKIAKTFTVGKIEITASDNKMIWHFN